MFSKAKKKGLKKEDFQFENGWFEKIVRKPGELCMQQFQISDCEECSIYLFDSSACVYVDDCKYCYVYIGPCESSVFIRNCHYMTIICVTQQFRVRDSTNCKIVLWCESQPIIESSHDLLFDCFNGGIYEDMYGQMRQAKLNLWNNNWFDIYDFTPRKFGKSSNHMFERLSQNRQYEKKLTDLEIKTTKKRIPYSTGPKEEAYCVLVVYPIPSSYSPITSIIHSRSMIVPSSIGLSADLQKKNCLFIKVKNENLYKWEQKMENIVGVVKDEKTIGLLESEVFVPFKDEH